MLLPRTERLTAIPFLYDKMSSHCKGPRWLLSLPPSQPSLKPAGTGGRL